MVENSLPDSVKCKEGVRRGNVARTERESDGRRKKSYSFVGAVKSLQNGQVSAEKLQYTGTSE